MFRSIGPPEILLILLVVLLLFGAKRLPDLSRSLGRSLRIFKSEVKKMGEDDDPPPPPTGSTTRVDAPTQELEGQVYLAGETPARPVPDRPAPDRPVPDRPVPDPERRDT